MPEEPDRQELGFNPHRCAKHHRHTDEPAPGRSSPATTLQLQSAPRAGLTSADRNRQSVAHRVLLAERKAAASAVPVEDAPLMEESHKGRRRPPEAVTSHKTGLVSNVPLPSPARPVRVQSSQISMSDSQPACAKAPQSKHHPFKRVPDSVVFQPPPTVIVDSTYRPVAPFFTGGTFS